jgi:holo-[acyl-carrier protein] synthase
MIHVRSGVDIVEVTRIDRAILRHGPRFFERFFTLQELVDAHGHTPALGARIAAKEAVAKALGTGIGEVRWKDIEIVNGPAKEPLLKLHGEGALVSEKLGITAWSISLTHTHEHAAAVAVALSEG